MIKELSKPKFDASAIYSNPTKVVISSMYGRFGNEKKNSEANIALQTAEQQLISKYTKSK